MRTRPLRLQCAAALAHLRPVDLPVGKGKSLNITNGFANAIVGGWQTGGTMTVQGGVPISLTIGGVDNSVSKAAMIDRTQLECPLTLRTKLIGWFNRAAFVEAPLGSFGNAGRDDVNSPPVFGFDAELHKSWTMPYSEHHRLQLRAEAFNVLNHPNWGEPNANILAGAAIPGAPAGTPHAGFGVISGLLQGATMRQLQVAMKYTF